jgi:sarcosine oxidase gamma subunit
VSLPLDFLRADPASPAWRSPLERALRGAPRHVRDVTALVDAEQVAALGPAAGVAGLELELPEAERVLRRLTDLDPGALPAVGAVAHVRALVTHEGGDRYRLWFPQEYSDYVAEVVLDALSGVA